MLRKWFYGVGTAGHYPQPRVKGHPHEEESLFLGRCQRGPVVLLAGRQGAARDVGCDIGKQRILVMLRWGEGDLEKPWRVRHPSALTRLRDLLVELSRGRRLRIGMEPTGTYADPLRQLLADAGLLVLRVGTKAAHD